MIEIRKKPNRDYEDYLTVGSSRAPFSMRKSLGLSFQKWLNNNKALKTRWGYLYRAKRTNSFIAIDRTYKERLDVSSFRLFYWEGSHAVQLSLNLLHNWGWPRTPDTASVFQEIVGMKSTKTNPPPSLRIVRKVFLSRWPPGPVSFMLGPRSPLWNNYSEAQYQL